MKKSINIMTLVCCLFAAVSCKVEFDIKGLDGPPIFLIDGDISLDRLSPEYGNISMYLYAVPSVAGERDFSEEARCTLRVYRNSELIDTKDYITIRKFFGLIGDSYRDIDPGDEITITAESDGFPTARASTVIPENPPAVDASCSMDGKDLKVAFSFTDNAETADAYAVCFRTLINDRLPEDGQTGGSLELAFGNSQDSFFPDTGPFDVTWEDGDRFYGISDDSFNGARKEFNVTIPDFSTYSYEGKAYFRIEIQRISPERLRYETACSDKGSNALGFIGLAPVTFAYTNISGGAGCFSAKNKGYTEWFEVNVDDNPVPDPGFS